MSMSDDDLFRNHHQIVAHFTQLACNRQVHPRCASGTHLLKKSNSSGIATKRHQTHNESRKGANQSQFCWLHQAHFHPFPFCVSCASSWLSSYEKDGEEAGYECSSAGMQNVVAIFIDNE
jgi:hypothetical protein